MSIADTNKVDFLWKKVLYGVSDTTYSKDATNETVSSPLPVYASSIWAQTDSTSIPSTPPTSNSATVTVLTGANRIKLTNDPTSPANYAWLSGQGDFIPPTF